MQTLVDIFTQEIPLHLRERVLRSITTTPRHQLLLRQWTSDDGCGCPMSVAAISVMNLSMDSFRLFPDHASVAANALGIETHRVIEGVRAWDEMSPSAITVFLDLMRDELGKMMS